MLKSINGKNQLDRNIKPVGSYHPVNSTCLTSNTNLELPRHDGSKLYTEQVQFIGWFHPEKLGRFKESLSIGSLISKALDVFGSRERINGFSV
jgi:hypothetical protein